VTTSQNMYVVKVYGVEASKACELSIHLFEVM